MRLIQLSVPEEQLSAVTAVLEDREFGYTVSEEAGAKEGHALVSFLTPADAVEHVLNDLEEAGYDRRTFTVSLQAEFASFEGIDDVQDHWAKSPNKIAPETLRSKAKSLRSNTRSYLWMMALSTVIATAGLLMGSPAVVVGAMVLAPIVSPMLTASVGAVRNDREMLIESLHMQGIGLGVALVGAVAFSLLLKHTLLVPTVIDIPTLGLISVRMSPSLLSVAVGLSAGAGGAFGLATKGNVSIVGVMIAAALIPTAAASGIAFAWGEYIVGVGALFLLLATILAVNAGGAAMLAYLGYYPDEVDEGIFELSTAKQYAKVGGTLALLLAIAVFVGFGTYQQIRFEQTANDVATEVLSEGEYEGLNVTNFALEYSGVGAFTDPKTVTLTVARTADDPYPDLANRIDRRLTEKTGQNLTVRVRFDDLQESNVTTSDGSNQSALRRPPLPT